MNDTFPAHDETELEKAHRLLEEVEELSRTGGWEYDVPTRHITWTSGVYRIYGISQDFDPDNLERCIGFYEPESIPIITEAFNKCLQHGEPYDLELRLIRGDGRNIWIRTVGRATRKSGNIVRLSGDIMDIDDLKRAQLETVRLNAELERRVADRTEKLERVNKDLASFSHAISHDLKAPLRAIAGFSRMVAEDYHDLLDAEGQRMLAVVSDSATTLDSLLTEILNLARTGTTNLDRANISMKEMVIAMYHEIASIDEVSTVHLEISDIPDCVGDSVLMRKVWGNLLDNALKFTSGRDLRTISIYAQTSVGRNTYFIKDNGTGFKEDFKEKLFLPFQRLHARSEYKGIGAGLALVKKIVELHGGTVGADGKAGQGAIFWFTIPLAPITIDGGL